MSEDNGIFEALPGRVLRLGSDGYVHGSEVERNNKTFSDNFRYVFVYNVSRKDKAIDFLCRDSIGIYVAHRNVLGFSDTRGDVEIQCDGGLNMDILIYPKDDRYRGLNARLDGVNYGKWGFENKI